MEQEKKYCIQTPKGMLKLMARFGALGIVPSSNWSAEVWDHSRKVERHIVKLNQRSCTCLEWQHIGKPCQLHVLAFGSSQWGLDLQ
jgi:hypothetical protein